MKSHLLLLTAIPFLAHCGEQTVSSTEPEDTSGPIRVLLIDGQNNHNWQATTPVLVQALEEEEGTFSVTVSTTPPKAEKGTATSPNDEKWADWQPDFTAYDVVVSNYNGELWPTRIQSDFEKFVGEGGGFVSVHAADNAFPKWTAYNEMIGFGGWNGRKRGVDGAVWTYIEDGEVVSDTTTKGGGGGHGPRREFVIHHMDVDHPVIADLPESWRHTRDELYCHMCGPAKNMTVLGHGFSNKSKKNEPLLAAISYGDGRIFHTTLGHDTEAMLCRGFFETLQRGTEWAATGATTMTAAVPDDFPTAKDTSPVDPE